MTLTSIKVLKKKELHDYLTFKIFTKWKAFSKAKARLFFLKRFRK